MNRNLFLAILAMDSYNRGYGQVLKISPTDSGNQNEIGRILGFATITGQNITAAAQDAGFYAIAYQWGTETIVSYRGTNFGFNTNMLLDVLNGWPTGTGLYGAQARLATDFYNAVAIQQGATDPRFTNITTTGHSLGAGLAGLVSSLYRRPATVFDHMSFASAVQTTYDAAVAGTSVGLWNAVYGNQTPWQPTMSGVSAFNTEGEVLEVLRILTQDPLNSVDVPSYSDLDIVSKHSMSLLVSLLWAQENNQTLWSPAGPALWRAFSDTGIANQINGLAARAGASAAGDAMATMIAYSALDPQSSGAGKPFGDTAIVAMFNDATDLGRALSNGDASVLRNASDALSQALVQYAGKLALDDVEGSTGETGMLDLSSDGLTLAADFSAVRCGYGDRLR